MPQDAALAIALPKPIQGWQPIAFLDRGVVVLFDDAAARLRAAAAGRARRAGTAGSRGVRAGQRRHPPLGQGRLAAQPHTVRPPARRTARAHPEPHPRRGARGGMRGGGGGSGRAGGAGGRGRGTGRPTRPSGSGRWRSGQVCGARGHRGRCGPSWPGCSARWGLGAQADAARLPRTLAAVIAMIEQMPDGQRPARRKPRW